MSKRIDFSALRKIPIEEVAKVLGISLKRTGSDVWNVKNENDPRGYSSLTINTKRNRWWRYSADRGGSTLDLVMEWNNCDLKTAAEFLTTHFPQYK